MATRRVSSQVLLGAVVVLIGVVLLAETTGFYDTSAVWDFVPSLFVLVGVYALVSSGFRNLFGPLVVIVFAAAWQLATLDVVNDETLVQFWPVLVVIFGLSLVAGRYRTRERGLKSDTVGAFAVFSGREVRATTNDFHGGDATALFGGVDIDLRNAEIQERPARLTTTALFGGVDVIVPREWNVEFDVLPVLGAAEDERLWTEDEHEEVDLVVEGFVAFGGVSLKD